jgi:GR25 family glycosyltransferase involved in LPS biosynthesis
MHALVINLDRCPERWAFTDNNLRAAGITAERFSAVDAKRLDGYEGIAYRPHCGERWELSDSLIACFESHRRIWQIIVDRDLPMAAIFEDDIVAVPALAAVLTALSGITDRFDIAKLDSTGRTIRLDTPLCRFAGFQLRPLLNGSASAAAYVVTLNGASRLLELSDPYCDHADDFIFMPRKDLLKVQLDPPVASQVMFLDDKYRDALQITDPAIAGSERERDPALNRKVRRGPPWFRLRKEIRRTARKLYWRLYGDRALLARGGIITDFAMTPDRIARLK